MIGKEAGDTVTVQLLERPAPRLTLHDARHTTNGNAILSYSLRPE